MRRFAPGASVVWRSLDRAHREVDYAWSRTVVRDDDELIVLYIPPGAEGTFKTGTLGGPRDRFLIAWDGGYRDATWRPGTDVIILYRPGRAHSVWLCRDTSSLELQWSYVNLEEQWRRTDIGFDSRDLRLDLWRAPNETEWQWKDEDELAWAVEHELIEAATAAAIRLEGEEAVRLLRREGDAMLETWGRWRPVPGWTVPSLSERWRDQPISH